MRQTLTRRATWARFPSLCRAANSRSAPQQFSCATILLYHVRHVPGVINLEYVCVRLRDRKSTRLNSSHVKISYAVFCLKKKNNTHSEHKPADHANPTMDDALATGHL